jgi:hypothetical protein
LWGSESAAVNIYLTTIHDCRKWESPFSYTLVPGKDYNDGQFSVAYSNLTSGKSIVNFNGTIKVATVTISGPITPPKTPHIFFLDVTKNQTVDVTNTAQPVRAVVGQKIPLFASPSGSLVANSTPWKIVNTVGQTGIVGGYTAQPCSEASCGPASVIPADFEDPLGTEFYWYIPGTYEVTYSSSLGEAKAVFTVEGPVGTITPTYVVPLDIDNTNHRLLLPNIDFTPTATKPPHYTGTGNWVQIILNDTWTENDPDHRICHLGSTASTEGLDGTYPYGQIASDHISAFDAPGAPLYPASSTMSWLFQARMYLVWTADAVPQAIPVPLCYESWEIQGSAKKTNGTWETPPGIKPSTSFVATPSYPEWSNVLVDQTSMCN